MNEYTQKWLSLFRYMRNQKPSTFDSWCFAVGRDGTDEERYHKGIEAAKMLNLHPPKSIVFEIVHQEIVRSE